MRKRLMILALLLVSGLALTGCHRGYKIFGYGYGGGHGGYRYDRPYDRGHGGHHGHHGHHGGYCDD